MKYYNIGQSNEIDVIGFYPQTERTEGYHVDSVNNILPNSFPDYTPQYGLTLSPKSIATDIIDRRILDFGMVISQKFKNLLEKFKLPPHRFYPIDVLGTDKKYFWFHYITNMDNIIDYRKTEIEVYNYLPPFKVEEEMVFNSKEDIMDFKKKIPYHKKIKFKKIQLKKDFPNYDLFEIVGAQYFTLISERLKDEIIKEAITGLEIIEYNQIKTM